MSDENAELREAVLGVVKGIVTYDQEEDAVDRIMQLVEEKHHCASCDMHACGDLDRGSVGVPLKGMSFGEFKAAGRAQYLNRYGHAITKEEWERLQDDKAYVRVACDEMRAGREPEILIRVSTLWSGINTGSGEIFESLVTRDGQQIDIVRYHTDAEANQGHNELLGEHFFADGLPGPKAVREVPLEEL